MVSRDCIEYCRQRTLSSSWTGHLDSDVWTLTSTGAGIVSVLFINAAPPPHRDWHIWRVTKHGCWVRCAWSIGPCLENQQDTNLLTQTLITNLQWESTEPQSRLQTGEMAVLVLLWSGLFISVSHEMSMPPYCIVKQDYKALRGSYHMQQFPNYFTGKSPLPLQRTVGATLPWEGSLVLLFNRRVGYEWLASVQHETGFSIYSIIGTILSLMNLKSVRIYVQNKGEGNTADAK